MCQLTWSNYFHYKSIEIELARLSRFTGFPCLLSDKIYLALKHAISILCLSALICFYIYIYIALILRKKLLLRATVLLVRFQYVRTRI